MPMPASTNAIAANAPSTRTCTARDAVSRSTISVSVVTSEIGSAGSIRWMIARTDGASASGGVDASHRERLSGCSR